MEMAVELSFLQQLFVSDHRLTCSANCTNLNEKCKATRIHVEHSQNQSGEVPVLKLTLDLGYENLARCVGTSELFEPDQKPAIMFDRKGPDLGEYFLYFCIAIYVIA